MTMPKPHSCLDSGRHAAARRILTLAACITVLGTVTMAQIRTWTGSHEHADGTTHWYDVVAVPGGIPWGDANRAAAIAGGYLATLTSKEENAAVVALIQDASLWSGSNGPWIGGVRRSALKAGWDWAQLDPFTYTPWGTSQPSATTDDARIHYGGSTSTTAGTWASSGASTKLPGFIIEYSGPTARRTVGLFHQTADSLDGYTLIAPITSKNTYLIDPRGRIVNTWASSFAAGLVAYLLPNGNLLRAADMNNATFTAGGSGGAVEEFDWNGNLIWQFQYSSDKYCLHHDVERLPNGNTLMISWELKTAAEALAAGRNTTSLLTENMLFPEKIIEVQTTGKDSGKIVWEWHAWDHLIQDFDSTKANYGNPAKRPERIDLNYTLMDGRADWLHANAIAYNAKLDQVILSLRAFSEFWIIDHSTTTAEAASSSGGRSGKGGDLLYRWGNPAAYRAGTTENQTLFYQHNPEWIPDGLPGAGNILVFNNRTGQGYSSVDEVVLPKADAKGNYPMTNGVWGPAGPKWSYTAPTKQDFYAPFICGAQRLPNGNTLICSAWRSFEVTPSGATTWDYRNADAPDGIAHQGDLKSGTSVFRTPRYFGDYPGLKGRTLTPGEPVERHDSVLLADGSTVARRVKPKTQVSLTLRAKDRPRLGYLVATSATPGLLQIDLRFARLGWDPLLAVSILQTAPTVFQNYLGRLDSDGRGNATLAIPDIPALIGLKLFTVFVVEDPASRSSVGMISNTVVVEIGS